MTTRPLDGSLRDRVALALHTSRRQDKSHNISLDFLPTARRMADAFLVECEARAITVVLTSAEDPQP